MLFRPLFKPKRKDLFVHKLFKNYCYTNENDRIQKGDVTLNVTSHLKSIRPKLAWISLAALTLIATVLRTLSLFLCMDEIGYFRSGATLTILFYVVIALMGALCIAIPFLINIERVAREPAVLAGSRFAGAAIAAVTLCAAALFLLIRAQKLPTPALLNLLTALALLCGATYFALHLTSVKSATVALWGYGAIFGCALSLILTYFDRYTQMNAPHKLSFHICMILVMLALLLELRDLLGCPLPRTCTTLTGFAAAFCTAIALPNLLAFAGGVYSDVFYLFFDIMTLGLATHFGTKCAQLACSPAKEDTQ